MSHEQKNSGKMATALLRASSLELSCLGLLADVFEKKAEVEKIASGDEEPLVHVLMISFLFLVLIV